MSPCFYCCFKFLPVKFLIYLDRRLICNRNYFNSKFLQNLMTDLQEIGKTANSCWSQIYERMRLRSIFLGSSEVFSLLKHHGVYVMAANLQRISKTIARRKKKSFAILAIFVLFFKNCHRPSMNTADRGKIVFSNLKRAFIYRSPR